MLKKFFNTEFIYIVILNIIFLIFAFLILDIISFVYLFKIDNRINKDAPLIEYYDKYKDYYKTFLDIDELNLNEEYIASDSVYLLRNPENLTSKKPPVLIFGCSYAYGAGLKENETFSYNLAKLTGRPIYNRGIMGKGVQHALIQLKSEEFYELVPKPEYIFYLYMTDQINRLSGSYKTISGDLLYVIDKKRNLVLKKESFLRHTFFCRFLTGFINKTFLIFNNSLNMLINKDLMVMHFKEMRKEIQKHYGDDTKFIILCFEDYIKWEKPFWDDLQKENFTIINLNELLNPNNPYEIIDLKYRISKDDCHPNAKLWAELTPKLVQNLKL